MSNCALLNLCTNRSGRGQPKEEDAKCQDDCYQNKSHDNE
jgi:hypothetical protein